jgi:hypothetical protein
MNELLMALNEGNSNDNKLQIEHLLLLGSTKSFDKSMKRLTDGLLEFGRSLTECLQIVSVGAALCLVLVGSSFVIRAIRDDSTSVTAVSKKSKKDRKDKTSSKEGGSSSVDEADDSIPAATSAGIHS